MAQGFKKLPEAPKGSKASKSARVSKTTGGKQTKKGARSIAPKKGPAVQSHLLKKRLTSEHIKSAEQQTAAKLAKPSGGTGLTIINSFNKPKNK